MPIVRPDRRTVAIETLEEIRIQLRSLLSQADGLQASIECLEIDLGLANEGEQAARDQLLVMHYPKGKDIGHTLDECTEECAASDALEDLGEDETEGKPEASKDNIGDASGSGE